MIFKEIITSYLLEIFLITISAYVAVKTFETRGSSRITKAFSAFATANMIFQVLDLCMAMNRGSVCFNGFATGSIIYVLTLITMAGTGYQIALLFDEDDICQGEYLEMHTDKWEW